jgi:Secretion system C-terminal sorting domain
MRTLPSCILSFALALIVVLSNAQTPDISWEKTWLASQSVLGHVTAFDPDGNSFIGGNFRTTLDLDPGTGTLSYTAVNTFNAFVVKLDANGNHLWSIVYPIESSIRDLHVDSDGNLLVCGAFLDSVDIDPGAGVHQIESHGQTDIFIARYNSAGAFQWGFSMGSTLSDDPFSADTDADGNVYVAGAFFDTVDFDPGNGTSTLTAPSMASAGYVAKYTSDGTFVWANLIRSTAYCSTQSLRIRPDGTVYVAGDFISNVSFDVEQSNVTFNAAQSSLYLAQYTPDGQFLWAKYFSAQYNFNLLGEDMDAGGDLYLAGAYTGTTDFDPTDGVFELTDPNNTGNAYVARYNGDGELVWVHAFGGETDVELAWDVAVGADGKVFLCGAFYGTGDFDPGAGSYDMTAINGDGFVAAIDENEEFLWAWSFGNNQYDVAHSVAVHPNGAVSCSSARRPAGDVPHAFAMLTRFEGIPQNVNDVTESTNLVLYPNPSHQFITIQSDETISDVRIFSTDGQLVCSYKCGANSKTLDTKNLAAGVYLVEVEKRSGVERRRAVVE